MAYYNKEDVRKYINDNNDKIENRGHKSVTPIIQSLTQLDNEEDVIGFFWVDINEESGDGAKVKMDGKTFIRIDFNLYTDDRFAIDLYQSQEEGITVTQVIKNRMLEQERAKKSIQENKDDLENGLSEKLTNKK
jgi:PDZ domain-containing secreted protein